MDRQILVGTRKGLFRLRNSASGWELQRPAFVGVPVTAVFEEPHSGIIHAALDHGHFGVKIQRTADGGESWAERPAPVYPPKPADVVDLDPMRNEPIPWSLKTVWAIAGSHPSAPQTLWCGTIPGGLFRSDDGGDSWQLNEGLWHHPARKKWFGGGADFPGIHSVLVDPRDHRRISVGVSCGGVWSSEDDGITWVCRAQGMKADYMPAELADDPEIQDPHLIVQCDSAPDHWWAQHHNGIFKSDNAGKLWQAVAPVAPSAFGFTVAVDPRNPNTAWFVPAVKDEERCPVDGKFVVTRTTDGGQSFLVLSAGLPQEPAYDLVFRHGLAVDSSGECLAMGSTTGAFWISTNAGDSWQKISSHLPPVYCVAISQY